MSLVATSAFAPDFTHTSAAPDFTLTFASGTSPVTGSLATGTYRMWLAPTATEYLTKLSLAIKLAILGARGGSPVVTPTMSAAGIATITFTADVPATVTLAADVWKRLGMATAAPTVTGGAIVGTRPVWGLALLSAVTHGPWLPQQAGGAEQTTGGVVYAIAAAATSWQRRHAVSFQPTTPTQRTAQAADATALLPAPEYMGALGSVATAREWSVLDVLYAARNAPCGLALGNWPTVRTSTSERFFYGYIGPRTLLSPELAAADETWDAWSDWPLDVVLPTAGASITRA